MATPNPEHAPSYPDGPQTAPNPEREPTYANLPPGAAGQGAPGSDDAADPYNENPANDDPTQVGLADDTDE